MRSLKRESNSGKISKRFKDWFNRDIELELHKRYWIMKYGKENNRRNKD